MKNSFNSFEEIRELVVGQVREIIQDQEVYIVCDVYARFSVYILGATNEILQRLEESIGENIERLVNVKKDDFIYKDLNNDYLLKPFHIERNIYYVDRHAQLTNWDINLHFKSHSPITCFYSFKGGLGRTTALVLTGIHLARKGKKVVLMDFDLEAPGLASIFAYQVEDINKIKGIVDYLIDLLSLKNQRNLLLLTDYYYTINQQDIVGSLGGEIILFPAGLVEGNENLYLTKLSKVDPLFTGNSQHFGIDVLLNHVNEELQPDHILIDTRTGLNELGGLFLSRYANTVFLFFFGNKQNMFGLETILPKLKAHDSLKFYLVNSPVPSRTLGEEQRQYYLDKTYSLFSEWYYNAEEIPFIEDETAPHFPIEIPYNDLAVLLNNFDKLRSLVEDQNGENPYLKIATLINPLDLQKTGGNVLPNLDSLSLEKHLALLDAFKSIVPTSAAAEYEFNSLDNLKNNFFPRKDYKFIFDKTKYLILGEKGAGKTALYAVLGEHDYAKALAVFCDANSDELQVTEWVKGMDRNYPDKAVFDNLDEVQDKYLRIFWKRMLLKSLKGEKVNATQWESFLNDNNSANELVINAELLALNDSLSQNNRIVTVVYDYLDVLISEQNKLRGRLISALLEVWRDAYNRYQNIRTKIFLRKDIFEREVNLTDKVKFNNHKAEITWEYDQLLNVVWKRIWHSNLTHGTLMEEWFDEIPHTDLGETLGFLPGALEQDNREILKKLLGEYMGGNNKAFPYNWILYHVSDTKRKIQPRSLLNLFSETANKQLEKGTQPGETLFQPRFMEFANEEVSKRRVQDIREEYPLLEPVFDNLKNYLEQFPVEESQLDEALGKLQINLEVVEIKRVLEEIGVLYEYKFHRKGSEKRYHIPDLYLIGMGLKRKGPGAHKALFGRK
ncbi:MAG: P-loop ATPase, Sll1717 family [Saprospiraceae bacterium]